MMKPLIGLTVLNIGLIVAPVVVAMPPVTQTPGMLAAAHAAEAIAPIVSVALSIAIAVYLWRRKTLGGVVLLVLALCCTALSRVNLLERVFAPATGVETEAAQSFHEIRDTDMVIGVAIGGRSRAYPVRYLAYHHMLNDQLGMVMLLPTY